MSAIIEKVFNWAHKIDKAVFKGSPNLITATDLNRQIELLKKEMFMTQQSVGPVSDFEAALTIGSTAIATAGTITATSGFLFFKGVRFAITSNVIGLTGAYPLQLNTAKKYRISLYATKTLIRAVDDTSKEISGAKFVDGTTEAAAEHYVYSAEELRFEEYTVGFFTDMARTVGGKEFICFLYEVYFITGSPIQRVLCIPFGESVQSKMLSIFSGRKAVPSLLFPAAEAGMSVDTALKALFDRLYTLERRLFLDTALSHLEDVPLREFSGEVTTSGGTIITVSGRYLLMGGVCFASGEININVPTITYGTFAVSFPEILPEAAFQTSLAVDPAGLVWEGSTIKAFREVKGYMGLDANQVPALCFSGGGIGVDLLGLKWSVAYPMEIGFWNKLTEDIQPIFTL